MIFEDILKYRNKLIDKNIKNKLISGNNIILFL